MRTAAVEEALIWSMVVFVSGFHVGAEKIGCGKQVPDLDACMQRRKMEDIPLVVV